MQPNFEIPGSPNPENTKIYLSNFGCNLLNGQVEFDDERYHNSRSQVCFNYRKITLKTNGIGQAETEALNSNERQVAVQPNHEVGVLPNPPNKIINLSNIEGGILSRRIVYSDHGLGAVHENTV